jgi:archaemetzincin
MASASSVRLVPIHLSDESLLDAVSNAILKHTGLSAVLSRVAIDPLLAFDRVRGQYSSTLLLENLPGAEDGTTLAVTDLDLYVPVLTFVFGEAQLNGPKAIVSVHRLQPEYYGLPGDDSLLKSRLGKEAVHELGHTFGLVHCPIPDCVMYSSSYVEEIDLKGAGYCPQCRKEMADQLIRDAAGR